MRKFRVRAQTQGQSELSRYSVVPARGFPCLSHPGELGEFHGLTSRDHFTHLPSELGTTYMTQSRPSEVDLFSFIHLYFPSGPPASHTQPTVGDAAPSRGSIPDLTPRSPQFRGHRASQILPVLQYLGDTQNRSQDTDPCLL